MDPLCVWYIMRVFVWMCVPVCVQLVRVLCHVGSGNQAQVVRLAC